jgi:hypothetical protein
MKKWILLFVFAISAHAQSPQCTQGLTVYATGRAPAVTNKTQGCNTWTFQYWTANAATISIEIDSANDNGLGLPGAWVTVTPVTAGANPSTTLSGLIQFQAYAPFLSVNITALTSSGSPLSASWTLYGASGITAKGGGGGGGANTFLSNLTNPTSLNQGLNMNGNGINTGAGSITANSGNVFLSNGSLVATPNGSVSASQFSTDTPCLSTASPAVCSALAAGSSVIAAAATTETVNTTRMTANSQILITPDSSLGTRLSVTCNTTVNPMSISARTGGTSFTAAVTVAPAVNPLCFSWWIIN